MMDATQDVRVINLPNLLTAKLGGQPGEGIMEELLKNAEAKVQELAADYLAWVGGDLKTLEGVVDDLVPASPRMAELLLRARDILHNMKGNGTTFGYDLITQIAQSGGAILRNRETIDESRREALRHHVAALRVVVDKKISGPGGEPGKRLVNRLQAIAAPFGQD